MAVISPSVAGSSLVASEGIGCGAGRSFARSREAGLSERQDRGRRSDTSESVTPRLSRRAIPANLRGSLVDVGSGLTLSDSGARPKEPIDIVFAMGGRPPRSGLARWSAHRR